MHLLVVKSYAVSSLFSTGVGKGLMGVITRPVGGVVDFASTSFEGIQR